MCASGPRGSSKVASKGCTIAPDAAASRSFPPEVAMYVVKIACERPDELGRSLSQWDCTEIARQLVRDGVVTKISAETVRQVAVHRCSSNSCTEVCARTSTFANGRLLVFQATVPGSYPLRAA